MKPTRNARFWVYENGTDVKLTLRPGQALRHHTGGPDEEGWSSTLTTWEFPADENAIYCESDYSGQEREDAQFAECYPQTEAQNCFAEAGMALAERNAKTDEEIARAINQGLAVVTGSLPFHCSATDAIVGTSRGIAHVALTVEQATDWIRGAEAEYPMDEIVYRIV